MKFQTHFMDNEMRRKKDNLDNEMSLSMYIKTHRHRQIYIHSHLRINKIHDDDDKDSHIHRSYHAELDKQS